MNYNAMELTKVAFEAITERFSKGKYLGVEVIIDMTNGYIQGAHLCTQVKNVNGKSKQFRDWLQTKQYEEVREYLIGSAGIPADRLTMNVINGPNEVKGTYIHPFLVPPCAQWASPVFAQKVSIIINEKAITEAMIEKDRTISELYKKIDNQTDIMLQQTKKIDDQSRQIAELLGYAKETKEDLEESLENQERLEDKIDEQTETIQEQTETINSQGQLLTIVSDKLGVARQEVVVPHSKPQNKFVFCAYRHNEEPRKYKVFRCQVKSVSQSVKKCTDRGYNTCVLKIRSPNSINLWNHVRYSLPESIGKISRLYQVELAESATEEIFLNFIKSKDEEKLEYGD